MLSFFQFLVVQMASLSGLRQGPAQRIRFGKKEQGSGRMTSFFCRRHKKTWSQSGLCGHVEHCNTIDATLPGLHPKPNRSPAKRVRFGKEEQRRERALTFVKKSEQAIQSLLRRGAGGGTRTHTVSLPTDFESVTSTNSITPAKLVAFIIQEAAWEFKCCFSRPISGEGNALLFSACACILCGFSCEQGDGCGNFANTNCMPEVYQ